MTARPTLADRNAEIIRRWNDGEKAAAIAVSMPGVTKNMVYGVMERSREAGTIIRAKRPCRQAERIEKRAPILPPDVPDTRDLTSRFFGDPRPDQRRQPGPDPVWRDIPKPVTLPRLSFLDEVRA